MASDPTTERAGSDMLELWSRQACDQAIVLMDPAGVIVGWRGAAEFVLGYSAQEALGRHISVIFTPEDCEGGYPAFELTAAAEDRYSEDARWHVRKDQARIWVTGTVTAVRDAAGSVVGFVKVLRDSTDQRTQIERFEARLAELDGAREQTRTFLRTLGHEIRNPLAVLANLHLIIQHVASDDRLRKVAAQLHNQVTLLKQLSDDLMDVSRLELGKVELNVQELDLRELLQQCASGSEEAASAKSVAIELIVPEAPLLARVDPARIQQVVTNLLNNAIKYNKVGGTVWIKAGQEGNEIVCRVQDDGIGIFPPVLPKIFELFSQAPEGKELRQGGIGVGLALVRQLVELHGGTVQARSPGIGKGAEFSFRLPALGASGGPAEADASLR